MFDAISGRSAIGAPIGLARFIDHGWDVVSQTGTSGIWRIPEWETSSLEHGPNRIVTNDGRVLLCSGSAMVCLEIAFDWESRDAGFNSTEPDYSPIAVYYDTGD